jgi:hypothetical protein
MDFIFVGKKDLPQILLIVADLFLRSSALSEGNTNLPGSY